MEFKALKGKEGITLVALVITIIVLIILAGVSINLVFNQNGIINKAKAGAQNMELAKQEEEEVLANLQSLLDNNGTGNEGTGDGGDDKETVEERKTKNEAVTTKTTLQDSNGNLIKVPAGFKIAQDSGINVTEGIVIEDNDIKEGIGNNRGNQYVWIPVGEGIKKSDGTSVDITLGRYTFASDGTETLKKNAENYANETEIPIKEIEPTSSSNGAYIELATARIGEVDIEDRFNDTNTTALNLQGFINSVKANGGYYIARYEASYGTDGKVNSKISTGTPATSDGTAYAPTTEGALWNNITQIDAATACRSLYEAVNSDLINSYAWDTAIVYIQEFSGETAYSRQTSKNTSLANTGVNGDEVCKINDMASNTREWTTEYCNYTDSSSAYPCAPRGGICYDTSYYTSFRYGNSATSSDKYRTFRSALYM